MHSLSFQQQMETAMDTMDNFAQMGYEDYQEMLDISKPLSKIINEHSNSNDMQNEATPGNFIKTYIKAIIDLQKDEEVRKEMLEQIIDIVNEFDALMTDAALKRKQADLAELHLKHFLED